MSEKDHSTAERASSRDVDPESQTEQHTQQPPSPNTEKTPIPIGWDGDNDPDNPHNWSTTRKTINVGIVCLLAFIPPLASSTITPGVKLMMKDFGTDNSELASFTVSVFVLGFAFGPLLLAPLSEIYGRSPVYNGCNVLFLGFNIGCALSPNVAAFTIFRFLAGCVGAAPMNIGGGSISDCIALEHRGKVMSIFFTGIFLGPVLGPVAGGFLAQGAGWRWVFWLLVILSGAMTVGTFLFHRESYAPKLLREKAKKKAKEAGVSIDLNSTPGQAKVPDLFLRSISRPLQMLCLSPIVTGLSLYVAVIYAYLYLLFTTFSTVFTGQYGFGIGILGLSYLGLGVGILIALVMLGRMSDQIQAKLTAKYGESKPEFRLVPLMFGIPFLPIGLFVYGWTAQYKVHWIVPIIFTGFTGAGLIFCFVPTQIYMVDAFTQYAASALTATSLTRSILGGVLPVAGEPMYNALGYGWGNSLLGFIALGLSVMPVMFYRYGEGLRKRTKTSFD